MTVVGRAAGVPLLASLVIFCSNDGLFLEQKSNQNASRQTKCIWGQTPRHEPTARAGTRHHPGLSPSRFWSYPPWCCAPWLCPLPTGSSYRGPYFSPVVMTVVGRAAGVPLLASLVIFCSNDGLFLEQKSNQNASRQTKCIWGQTRIRHLTNPTSQPHSLRSSTFCQLPC